LGTTKKTQYCKFCGSPNLTNIRLDIKQTKTKEFKPEITYHNVGVTAGSIKRKTGSTMRYISKFCKLCRNLEATELKNPTPPLEAYASDLKKTIIIPYTLATHLNAVEYEPDEIISLISKIKSKLNTIYNRWSITGVNPCKDEHVGKKLEIKLKHGVEIICWVIMDSFKDKVLIRLSYGGGKITCPEG